MSIWVAYVCGLVTPLVVFVAGFLVVALFEWFAQSKLNPFSGSIDCVVCDRPVGHRWQWWIHRLTARHRRLYPSWKAEYDRRNERTRKQ